MVNELSANQDTRDLDPGGVLAEGWIALESGPACFRLTANPPPGQKGLAPRDLQLEACPLGAAEGWRPVRLLQAFNLAGFRECGIPLVLEIGAEKGGCIPEGWLTLAVREERWMNTSYNDVEKNCSTVVTLVQ